LLNCHGQELTLDGLVGIRKQSAVREAEESEAESKERSVTVSDLSDVLGHTEAGVSVSEDTDLNEQRAARTR
jgi:hypothetical protein